MDKETLSNYGWIVICVLVLAVMLAFATPFGTFIADGFKATYTGLFQTGDNALDVGLSAVGVSNKLPCGHGRKEAGDHSQKECGHYNCQDTECGCVPASCGVDGHWSGDGMDHDTTVYGHRTHSRKCQCTPGWTVPDGGTYTLRTAVDGKTVFNGGETLPDCYVVSSGDKFLYGDYEYGYHQIYYDNNGWPGWTNYKCNWSVHAVDKTKTSYGPILTSINGKVVDSLYETFFGCTNLTSEGIPEIPNSIKIMSSTFKGCSSITTAPTIPEGVEDMHGAFWNCTSLETAPNIPQSVTKITYMFINCKSLKNAPIIYGHIQSVENMFSGCTSLTGTITINTNNITTKEFNVANSCSGCFGSVDMTNITLTGSASKDVLNLIGSTGKNWTPIS